MYKYIYLIVLNLSFISNTYSIVIGSDTVPSKEQAVVFSSSDNQVLSFAAMQNGFVLKDSQTHVKFNSLFPVCGSVELNGGLLELEQDLTFRDPATLKLGNIIGNGHVIELSSGISKITSHDESKTNYNFDNMILVLNNNLTLENAHIRLSGKTAILGRGNTLTLGKNASLYIEKDSSLLLKNVNVSSVHENNIACLDNSSKILLDDCTWLLSNNYSFEKGCLDILNDFEILGENCSFIYLTNQESLIQPQGNLKLTRGVILQYDPSSRAKNLLRLVDTSSTMQLSGATLSSHATGMEITKGKIIVDCKSYIYSNADSDKAIAFGDGKNEANNVTIQWLPAATLEVIKGKVLYNNI